MRSGFGDESNGNKTQGMSVGDLLDNPGERELQRHNSDNGHLTHEPVTDGAAFRRIHSSNDMNREGCRIVPSSPVLVPLQTATNAHPLRVASHLEKTVLHKKSNPELDVMDVERGIQLEEPQFMATEDLAKKFVLQRKNSAKVLRNSMDQEPKKSILDNSSLSPNYVPEKSTVTQLSQKYKLFVKHKVRDFVYLHQLLDINLEKSLRMKETFWIDFAYPTREDMAFCESVFDLHPLTTEDVLLSETREKMELFENYLLISIQISQSRLQAFDEPDDSFNWFIAVYPEFVLSFHSGEVPYFEPVLRRVKTGDANSLKPDWIMYTILDVIVEAYQNGVDVADSESESLNEIISALSTSERDQSEVLCRVGQSRKRLANLYRSLNPKREIVMNLINRKTILIHKRTYLYLRDILDDCLSMLQKIEYARETLTTAQSNYLATVSLNVSKSSNELNAVMSKLTLAATIFLPLNVITGMFGMNVRVPGQSGWQPDQSYYDFNDTLGWFFIINAAMLLIIILLCWWAKATKLL